MDQKEIRKCKIRRRSLFCAAGMTGGLFQD